MYRSHTVSHTPGYCAEQSHALPAVDFSNSLRKLITLYTLVTKLMKSSFTFKCESIGSLVKIQHVIAYVRITERLWYCSTYYWKLRDYCFNYYMFKRMLNSMTSDIGVRYLKWKCDYLDFFFPYFWVRSFSLGQHILVVIINPDIIDYVSLFKCVP